MAEKYRQNRTVKNSSSSNGHLRVTPKVVHPVRLQCKNSQLTSWYRKIKQTRVYYEY